ncbi:MAG: cell division protein FtsK [Gammaproteobacteria bacterium]|nr:cell division protein FtsK [Gammaproteobacteria bacterium]NIN61603.1 cell division protein FtsK [Gammaproteobacteria bacterium]NIO62797.1 cell division protein FtsK [Gammaproteobacteria bacterium]NIQ09564.1 cell division protein FtsK [Gammaproteobacteria bacterium]NIQ19361.1 cell division protein FtsK [Gammaproteobacteria bacterium]
MAQASRKRQLADELGNQLSRNIREVSLIALAALSIYLFIALLSYHPDDPGWSHAISVDMIRNSAGKVGAWIADVLLYLFGFMGYLFPILLGFSGWRVYQALQANAPLDYVRYALRSAGLILAYVGGCGLARLYFLPNSGLPYEVRGAGGILGDVIGSGMVPVMGMTGSTLLLLAMFLIGITLFTGLSWLWLMDVSGHWTLRFLNWANELRLRLRDELKGRVAKREREILVQIDQNKGRQREPVRVEPKISLFATSDRAEKERQVNLFEYPSDSTLPSLNLLNAPPARIGQLSHDALQAMSRQVELKLADFGIDAQVVEVHPGPVITRFELEPAPGVKGGQIINLAKDLARSLSVTSVRVVDVIPGKSVIGLEIPNENRELVVLSEILNSREYEEMKSHLTLGLGKDISGKPVVTDLGRMPHLLVAGTTGAGKSVALNAMILGLLYKSTAKDIRLIMIDPKMLELSVYEGIPHLLAPVVTDMKEAANALRWCVAEMERRYRLMAALGVRNITGFNRKITEAREKKQPIPDPLYQPLDENDEIPILDELPFIVVIVDELADMMMTVGKKVEELIARLAQKARASGIHLILATQRPSVDVITGLIKANIPCRIAFQVSSKVDSRTILDQMGAETLLGNGDMLFLPPGTATPVRIHGAFVADQEVHKVANELKKGAEPDYHDEIIRGPLEGGTEPIPGLETVSDDLDPLYDEAVRIVTETRKASISYIQRRLKIGYNRAARMVEEMEQSGIVGPLESNGSRDVIAPPPPE